ncbi:MAG: hypothetical protein ACFFAN_05755 [Promethearchaeota archaeon]
MKKGKKITDIFSKSVPAGVIGLISVGIRICCDILAIIFFPGIYNIFENMISELGVGPGGIFFNVGIIISSILAIPFYIYFARTFRGENGKNKLLVKITIILSVISCISLMMVGFFPAIIENRTIHLIHGGFALICWLSALAYILIFSVLMLKDQRFTKFQVYYSFIVAGLLIIALCTWLPITEWLMNIGIIIWLTFNAFYIIYRKI